MAQGVGTMSESVRIGSVRQLQVKGCVVGKVGSRPVCVFLADGKVYAVEDRCPHMGFPLHRGSVEDGLLTCHWHHARFDLASGGALDPWADDVATFAVELRGDEVHVTAPVGSDPAAYHLARLREGLEQGLTLVISKAVLGLYDALGPEAATRIVVTAGCDFGLRFRQEGWGAGLTVLVAMANVVEELSESDRVPALVHGLRFVARDTLGHGPRFSLGGLAGADAARLPAWYRRFVATRSGEAAERCLVTAAESGLEPGAVVAMMVTAATDHVFLDGGHTVDFTNKAVEALDHLGWERAGEVLSSLARQTAAAGRAEDDPSWRAPEDLVALAEQAAARPVDPATSVEADRPCEELLADDAWAVVGALDRALDARATIEEAARAVALAAALRLTRFHVQNDHGDWDVVHHAFTFANAVHALVRRAPTVELLRAVYQAALKVYLDRFLNVPASRLEAAGGRPELTELEACWERQGLVDEAGSLVYRFVRHGGSRPAVLRALGSALLAEDPDFHCYQMFEAAVAQSKAWPQGSEPVAIVLAAAARFLAAHTPTRRELPQVLRIAGRLRRGEALYEGAG